MLLLPSCGLRRKESTSKTRQTEEETDDEETDDTSDDPVVPNTGAVMNVKSLDAFISDGSIFADNVPVPTPTPIPVKQSTLGLTNEDDGYFSGPLENATIVDNEFFRFTIVSAVLDGNSYTITSEFENRTDVPYTLYFRNPILNNESTEYYFYMESAVEPHTVYTDVTDYPSVFKEFDGTEPTRIAFLLLAVPVSSNLDANLARSLSDPNKTLNYIPVTLFPQGEDAFVYEDAPLGQDSTIVYDSDGAEFIIDSFEVNDYDFRVNFTFVNKTSEYIVLMIEDGTITLDKTVFDTGNQFNYIPPYGRLSSCFSISISTIKEAGLEPTALKSISIPLIAQSLNNGNDFKVLWETVIKKEINFG